MYKESKVQNDVTSDHILVLSEQDGDIVGNMSFRDKKKIICSLVTMSVVISH